MATEEGKTTVDGNDYTIKDFCFRPITGQGCLIPSPMDFWKVNLEEMKKDKDVKFTAQCIPTGEQTGRICFDRNGVPVQVSSVFGGVVCVKDDSVPCAPCRIDASAFMITMLLNNNDYSNPTAIQWEMDVLIRNIKSFNYVSGYQKDLPKQLVDLGYNWDLINKIEKVYQDNPKMLKLKIDYLSERSIPDQISDISEQNSFVAILSYLIMFMYVVVAIGYFPTFVHNRFLL